jgi:purine-nucleoside phosphorylase
MPAMSDALDRATRSARELARRIGIDHHDVLVVLGSGLSSAGEILGADGPSLPLDTLPFFPTYAAAGHRTQGWSVRIEDRQVLILGGRCHLYEGLEPAEVVHPLRTGIATGCSTVILTTAVGGIRDDLTTGSIMVVEDHLNLTARSPLTGPGAIDMVGAYPAALRDLALATSEADATARLSRHPGTYAQVPGPQLETPAEINWLRVVGADVVGMSLAIETIAARDVGADVLALSLVTNRAATATVPTDVAGIHRVGADAAPAVAAIVRHVVSSLP